jgi:TRAP-type C4-dicarboxylate transport system permease small subunit
VDKFVAIVEKIAGSFLLAIAILTFGSVFLRYVFATQIPDWFDFSKLLQGIAIFWGIACICFRNEHIMVDLLWEKSNDERKRYIDLAATTVLLIFLLLMAWMLGAKVWQSVQSTQATSDLRIPIGPFHVAAWLGVVAAIITTTMRLINVWRRSRQGELTQISEI